MKNMAACKQTEEKHTASNHSLCSISIYSEHKLHVSVLNLTIECGKSLLDELDVSIEDNAVRISTGVKYCTFLLGDLELLPLSCRGLQLSPTGQLQMTLQVRANDQQLEVEDQVAFSCRTQDSVCANIQKCQGNCFCSCCGERILKEDSCFSRVLPLPSENWSDLADFWFCHHHGDDDHSVPSISLKTGDCLVGNLHVRLSNSHVNADAVKSDGDVLFCRRCYSVIGVRIQQLSGLHVDDRKTLPHLCHLYLHSVVFKSDLSSINSADLPTGRRVELFVSRLLQEQSRLYTSFRFLVQSPSSGSAPHSDVKLLLWLVDHEVTQFTGSGNMSPDFRPLAVVGQKVHKVLFRCIINSEANETASGQSDTSLFRAWERDNSVHGLALPRPLCLQLAAILVHNTRYLPASARHLDGFHVSYLLKDTSSDSGT